MDQTHFDSQEPRPTQDHGRLRKAFRLRRPQPVRGQTSFEFDVVRGDSEEPQQPAGGALDSGEPRSRGAPPRSQRHRSLVWA